MLDKLGGSGWQTRKAKLKKRIRDMAEQLIKIAAERQLRDGPVIDAPQGVYEEFCARFPYGETEDQEKAIADVMEDAAVDMLSSRLRTPMQIERHMTRAFEEAYQSGTKPVTAEIVDSVMSRQIDDLEPTLVRHGYDAKVLADQFNTRPLEIKKLIAGELDPSRVKELTDEMRLAGIPI